MKKILPYLIAGACLLTLILIGVKVVSADTSDAIPQIEPSPANSSFDTRRYLPAESINIYDEFPYAQYLDSANYRNIRSINQDILLLDSFNHDPGSNRRTLSHALTEVWGNTIDKRMTTYQPDSLLALVQWAEQFYYYAQFDPDNDIFYQSIYTYWLSFVTNKLSTFSQTRPSLRHDYKFKYLVSRCQERKFSTRVKITSSDKFIENILYSRWGHLVHATWNQSSWLLKLAGLACAFVFVLGLIYLSKLIFRIIKK